MKEQKAAITERERFMEENESKLFEKMMAQQEKETELEQREEDLKSRARQFKERESAAGGAAVEPAPAKPPEAAKKQDELSE